MSRFTGIFGLLTMLGLAYVFSTNRSAIRMKTVVWGLTLQILFAFLVLRLSAGRALFAWLGDVVTQFLNYAFAGSAFVFGDLGKKGPPFVLAFQ
ncbi:MAG: NupC/NupG family nucleoside CNT transporter, partial [Acidobacteriales bacterium]|nr:NupC/NupG family nucleoside CNT transporter [Terriglobales bacterium]